MITRRGFRKDVLLPPQGVDGIKDALAVDARKRGSLLFKGSESRAL